MVRLLGMTVDYMKATVPKIKYFSGVIEVLYPKGSGIVWIFLVVGYILLLWNPSHAITDVCPCLPSGLVPLIVCSSES